jgi:hypothetical protein
MLFGSELGERIITFSELEESDWGWRAVSRYGLKFASKDSRKP